MLLNQCLAISLSPTGANQARRPASARGQEEAQETRLSLAQFLFKQLVEQNSLGPTGRSSTLPTHRASLALSEALSRLEFAGFMVPSWLLVSGAYDDLQRVKTSWSEGGFKSPSGFKIETIGNIRSVNVDYFGLTCQPANEHKHQVSPSNPSAEEASSRSGGRRQDDAEQQQADRCPSEQVRPMTQQQQQQRRRPSYADRNSPASTSKSKSTTLDSGCQSWDLASGEQEKRSPAQVVGEDHEKEARRSRLSTLARSLSFRPRRSSAGNRWPEQGQLARSSSVRAVHSQRPPKGGVPATIDYLAGGGQRAGRFSLRRSSLLAFGKDEQPPAGRLLHFLRKLFSGSRRTAPAAASEPPAAPEEPAPPSRPAEQARPSRLASHESRRELLARKLAPLSSPSTSDASSGPNSLIEILDVQSSRRPLRHEQRASSAGLRRASWRLVKRSESSLSHNSEASSASTTKSTVSQQLRRHLDEACKRPRNCASQREKDFIDSINVLRHASRHALQSSRSSSKSRQAKSVGAKSQESGDESASSLGSPSCACSHREPPGAGQAKQLDHYQHPLDLMVPPSPATCCLCTSYLASPTRLCPLTSTCCTAPSAYGCCLAPGPLEEPPAAELCCPIWRSMLCNYYPPPYGLGEPAPPPNPIGLQTSRLEQLAGSQSISSSHHHQQHQQQQQQQHNTTIDLKIEIGGADFAAGKPTRKTSKREPATTDDSLDSSENSLAPNKSHLEPDSCDSDAKSATDDSLGAEEQTGSAHIVC